MTDTTIARPPFDPELVAVLTALAEQLPPTLTPEMIPLLRQSTVVASAVDELVSSTFEGFAASIADRAERPLTIEEARGIAAVGLSSLVGSRLMGSVLAIPTAVDDDLLVGSWVQMMLAAISAPEPTADRDRPS